MPLAARQGDFRVENILLDGDRVRVVDFENFAETDAIYEDVCALLSYLTLLSCSPLYASSRVNAAASCPSAVARRARIAPSRRRRSNVSSFNRSAW